MSTDSYHAELALLFGLPNNTTVGSPLRTVLPNITNFYTGGSSTHPVWFYELLGRNIVGSEIIQIEAWKQSRFFTDSSFFIGDFLRGQAVWESWQARSLPNRCLCLRVLQQSGKRGGPLPATFGFRESVRRSSVGGVSFCSTVVFKHVAKQGCYVPVQRIWGSQARP